METTKWTLEDGRRVERRIVESNGDRIIETHMEDPRPLHLHERIVEKTRPEVYERCVETLGADGKVTEKRIEATAPKLLQVVDHITTQSIQDESPCDCHVTREEMIDTIVEAVKSLGQVSPIQSQSSIFSGIHSYGIAEDVAKKVNADVWTLHDKVWAGVAVGLSLALAYLLAT